MTAGPSPAPAVAYGPVDVRTGTIPKLAEAVERIAAERGGGRGRRRRRAVRGL